MFRPINYCVSIDDPPVIVDSNAPFKTSPSDEDVTIMKAVPAPAPSRNNFHPMSTSFEFQYGSALSQFNMATETIPNILSPLCRADRLKILSILDSSADGGSIVAQVSTDTVQLSSFKRLKPTVWLNDELIHFYMTCLANRDKQRSLASGCRRSHFFKSYFMTKFFDYGFSGVKRWSRNVPGRDIFALDKIIFPLNVGGLHWNCIVAFMQDNVIEYHDSLGGPKSQRSAEKYMKAVLSYFEMEHLRSKKTALPDEHWILVNEKSKCFRFVSMLKL